MGFVCPPRALTSEEFAKAGFRDIEFEKWVRYSNGLGPFIWIWDWLRGDLISEKNKKGGIIMDKKDLPANFREAKVVEVIEVECLEGHGTDKLPYRLVQYYHAKDGTFLAKRDGRLEDKNK